MKTSIKRTAVGVLALVLFASSPANLQAQMNDNEIKITDSKLHPINYGIDSLDHWIAKAKSGDNARATTLLRDLAKLEARFGRLPASESEQYKYVANRLKESRLVLERKSSTASKSDSESGTPVQDHTHHRSNPELINIGRMLTNLQMDIQRYRDNHKQRSRMRSDLEAAKRRLGRVPVSNHPDYLAIKEQLENTESALQPSGEGLQMEGTQVAEYVESIRIKYSERILLPEPRDIMKKRELTAEDVDGILSKLKTFRENVDKDLPKLRQVVEATGQGAYWLKWLETDSTEKLKRNMESIKQAIDTKVNSGLRNVKQRSELDPERNKYAFTTESVRASHEAEHGRTLRTLQQAARLEQLLELPVTWSPKINELNDYIATYNFKANAASTVRELPPEVGTEEHHLIAKDVFKIENYDVGKVIHTIVNSKPVSRDHIEHVATGNKLETIVRKWREYQVTTVEQEGEKLLVYVNNLANFSRGPGTTPLNQWIMKQRFKRGEISQEDFDSARDQK